MANKILDAFRWLFLSRQGLLSIWLAVATGTLGAALYWHFWREPIFLNESSWWLLATASSLACLPFLLLMLDPPDNYSEGPRHWLPLWTLVLLMSLAAWATLDHLQRWRTLDGENANEARILFFVFFGTALIPRIWNAINFARFDAERRDEKAKEAKEAFIREQRARYPHSQATVPEEQRSDQDAESVGALLATLAVVLIGYLAFAAGDGSSLSLQSSFGFFLCFSVIGVFIAVVCIDALAEWAIVRDLSQAFESLARAARPLAAFYNLVDTVLVRLGAAMMGMGHQGVLMRYVVLVGTMTALCLMGWYLPPPLGLVPALLGFVFAMSVSRLWNWVEEDRALAAMTEYSPLAPYRLDFREDYRDETLLAFVFVFLLAPIAMMQANDGGVFGPHLFNNADGRHLGEWIGFFGIELAKAIPVVDWAEIYGVRTNSEMIAINGAASRHAVFLARVMVDLVLIAALLQAVGIWTRSRQQKQLYDAGHIDRLDPFVERIEFVRALRVARPDKKSQRFDLTRLGRGGIIDFRTYDEKRLFAIYASTADEARRAFIETIAHERGIALVHSIDLAIDLAENGGDAIDLATTFQRAVNDHRQRINPIDANDLYRILTALRARRGLRAFKELTVDFMEEVASPAEVVDLLSGLAEGERADAYQYARDYMRAAIAKARKRM